MITMNGALFAETYLPLRDVIHSVCSKLMSSVEDADDVTQDVFLKLWEDREALDKIDCPKAFVIRVARNRCLDRLKSPAVKLRDSANPIETVALAADTTTDPHAQLVAKEQNKRLMQWVSRLKEPKRSIFHLRQFEMLSNEETAERLGLQEVTVRSTLSRLRKEAREILFQE